MSTHYYYYYRYCVDKILVHINHYFYTYRHIPTVIVQGRYDVVCPAVSAYDLKTAFPEAELIYTLTGHSGFEKLIIEELVKATERFKNRN